jgi:lysozyme family protein
MDTFKLALDFTLRWEGSYVNDPSDPGGETNFGISKRAHPEVDIKGLTKETAGDIYRKDYWEATGCDVMTRSVAICAFDSAVNCGVGRTKGWVADLNVKDEEEAKRASRFLLQKRLAYYASLVEKRPVFKKYIRGWNNRVNDLSKYIDIVE